MEDKTIKDFTQLHAWQKSHSVVLDIYLLTKSFPKVELFGLVTQMRRSAVSITSNIAEGFGRHSIQEKRQFYRVALGSISELQSQLFVARDTDLITQEQFNDMYSKSVVARKLVFGLKNGKHMNTSETS